jgi:hypothetical protein
MGGDAESSGTVTKVAPSALSFDTVCRLFESLTGKDKEGKQRGWPIRLERVRKFVRECIDRDARDAYAVFRLILPHVSFFSVL